MIGFPCYTGGDKGDRGELPNLSRRNRGVPGVEGAVRVTEYPQTIKSRFVELSWNPIGFIRAVVLPGAHLTVEDAVIIGEARQQLCPDRRCPLLLDIRHVKSATKECRVYGSSRETPNQPTAMALLVSSPVSRVIGNFYMGLNKPFYPTKLFTSEESAVDWLKGFR